jgi:hypothetical protein
MTECNSLRRGPQNPLCISLFTKNLGHKFLVANATGPAVSCAHRGPGGILGLIVLLPDCYWLLRRRGAGFALLANAHGALPMIGVMLLGLGLGTEIDLIAFLVSRYFGQLSFGADRR